MSLSDSVLYNYCSAVTLSGVRESLKSNTWEVRHLGTPLYNFALKSSHMRKYIAGSDDTIDQYRQKRDFRIADQLSSHLLDMDYHVKKINLSNLTRRQCTGAKDKNSTAERHLLDSMKDSIKSIRRKARGRNVTMHQEKTHISLPWVDPQERINILRGQGPLLQLGDVGASAIDISLDPALLREKRALEQHFKPHSRSTRVETDARALRQRSKSSKRVSFDGGTTLGGPEYNNYSENSLIQGYSEDYAPRHGVRPTGRDFASTDDNNYQISRSGSDTPSHGILDCQRLAHDGPQGFAPQTWQPYSSEGL
jgi:hypothetical protein